jgi:hypothetical protein
MIFNIDSSMYTMNLSKESRDKESSFTCISKENKNKYQFLYFYEIEMISSIIDNNFNVYKCSINDNNIYIDIGQSIIDNMFSLFLLYLDTDNLDILFPINNKININIKSIIDIYIHHFKIDVDNLLFNEYNINKINEYNNGKLSLLGFFIYKSIKYFFDLKCFDKDYILYDFIYKIFIILIENKCNPNIVNHFPDNNIMSISAYVLLLMIYFTAGTILNDTIYIKKK